MVSGPKKAASLKFQKQKGKNLQFSGISSELNYLCGDLKV